MLADTLQGLPAQLDGRCRVLVLGSMPGEQSLRQQRYYAHPRNRFWPLLADLLGFAAGLDYAQRIAAMRCAGVGLWDVIGQCRRRGSLDAAIEPDSIVVNPLPQQIALLPELAAIACNGAAAAKAWRRHVEPRLSAAQRRPLLVLPSTSPANAAWSPARLREDWSALLPYLRDSDD